MWKHVLAIVVGFGLFISGATDPGGLADAAAQRHFMELAARLRAAGAQVEEKELPPAFADAHAAQRTVMYGEGARVFAELQRRERGRLSPRLNALIDELRQPRFRDAFENKGRFASAMGKVPVYAVMHPQAGLLGAAPGHGLAHSLALGDARFRGLACALLG